MKTVSAELKKFIEEQEQDIFLLDEVDPADSKVLKYKNGMNNNETNKQS